MIESCYWKEELARIAKLIRPAKLRPRWSGRAHCVVERDLMLGFFIARRLIKLHKVSSVSREFSMKVFSCPSRGKHVHRMNCHDIYDLYNLEKERRETKKPFYISNQFIHAYTSFVARDEKRNWSDVYVVSDYDRNDCIWRVPIPEIRRLFSVASRDYPHSVHMIYDQKKRDYQVSTA